MGQPNSATWGNALLVFPVVACLSACAGKGGPVDDPAWVQDRTRTIHLPSTVSLPTEAELPRTGLGQGNGFKTDLAGAVRRAVEREIVRRGLFSIVQPTAPAHADLLLSVESYGVGEMQAGTYYAALDVTATLMQDDKRALWTNRKAVSISDRYQVGERNPVVSTTTSTVLQAGLERAAARAATELLEKFESSRAAAQPMSGEIAAGDSGRLETPRTLVRVKTVPGKLSYQVEAVAKDENCRGPEGQRPVATLIGVAPALEVYSVSCAERGAMLVRCEYRGCSVVSDLAPDASVHDQSKPFP